ncbi:MAG: glycosyltransferase [Gemmatimonadetes bacterium]|nr:glycosyltransferase [Gemmatimonadota bacterium]
MKILHLSKFFPPDRGGVEHVVGRLAEGAAGAGHEVRVISATGSSWLRPRGFRVTEPPRGTLTVVRIPTPAIVWSQPIAPGYVAAARWPADVLHVHHPHPLADVATLLRGRSAPIVVTHHSDIHRQAIARPFYGPLVRAVLRRARVIVVATEAHVSVSRELSGFESKIRVIPFGVNPTRFAPRSHAERPAGFPPEGPVGLFVGRMVGYKGLDVLARAMAGTGLSVVVAGGGPVRPALEEQIKRLGLERQLHLVGEIAEDDLPACYQSADYFVLPSTSPAEMFGVALLEAMACAKPVISTALPTGVREVNQRDVTGLEVPPGDVEALRSAMQRLASDGELRGRLGAAGRRRVEERFTVKQMVDAHLELYREVVAGGKR